MSTMTLNVEIDPLVSRQRLAELLRQKQRECHANVKQAQGRGDIGYVNDQASLAGFFADVANTLDGNNATDGET